MKIEIINKTKRAVRENFVRKIIKKAGSISGENVRKLSLSVVFAGKAEIQSLNRRYRRKDKPTDVLSFNYASGYNRKGKGDFEGELILSPGIIAKSAKESNISFERELAYVLSHGVLHILGMKHSKKMFELQDKVISIEFHE